MKTLTSLLFAVVFSTSFALAQNAQDALILSQTESGGTARYMSMGGAFSALGADFSSLSTNPAGIAAYRTSEMTFTPSLNFNSTESNYSGTIGNDSKTNFNIGNFGYVGTNNTSRTEGIVSVSFGIGFNRIKDYTRNYYAHNNALKKSLTDYFAGNESQAYEAGYDITNEDAGYPPASYWDATLGYDASLIFLNADHMESILGIDETVSQSNFISEAGRLNEFVLSMGMNISNKFLLGGTVGIQDIYFKRQTVTLEDFGAGGGFTYSNQLKTRGAGINLKLGAIFLPVENLRIGLAIHTPTFITLDDDYSSAITNVYGIEDEEGNTIENKVSPLGEFEYELQTPSKVIAGAAIIIDKRAIISVDYEMSDYSSMKFSTNGATQEFIYINQDIKNVLDVSHTYKAGIEYRVTPEFSLRGGYSNYGTPYKNEYNLSAISGTNTNESLASIPYDFPIMTMPQATTNLSGGFGFRDQNFFVDFAFIHSTQDVDYLMFNIPDIGSENTSSTPYVADITSTTNRYMVTIGLKF